MGEGVSFMGGSEVVCMIEMNVNAAANLSDSGIASSAQKNVKLVSAERALIASSLSTPRIDAALASHLVPRGLRPFIES